MTTVRGTSFGADYLNANFLILVLENSVEVMAFESFRGLGFYLPAPFLYILRYAVFKKRILYEAGFGRGQGAFG